MWLYFDFIRVIISLDCHTFLLKCYLASNHVIFSYINTLAAGVTGCTAEALELYFSFDVID